MPGITQGSGAVRVVLGEGQPGILRLVLESQGFDVIGHARGDDELRLVLAVTHPSVVVLDAGISAATALEARKLVEGVPIVAVWPSGVAAVVAEERVEPGNAIQDLGEAVRRAARRGHGGDDLIRLPDLEERPAPADSRNDPTPAPVMTVRPRRKLLVAIGAWLLSLTALGTIGLAVPRAFDLLMPDGRPRPSITERPSRALEERRERAERPVRGAAPSEQAGNGPACGQQRETRPEPQRGGTPDDPGSGCGKANGNNGRGKGRPADPGARGQGNRPEQNEKDEKDKTKDDPIAAPGSGSGNGGGGNDGADGGNGGGNGGGGGGNGNGGGKATGRSS